MVFVLITLTATLILNAAVLAMLKMGLRDERGSAGDFSGRLPC